ncbi:MAG: glycoside hydrolase family 140 protein, partial [Bacillota bacterium]
MTSLKRTAFLLILFALAVSWFLIKGETAVSQKVVVSGNGRFLTTEDGQPFFWLGDTAWELFHRLNRSEVETYLSNRAAKGFNVIQCVLLAELDGLGTANALGDRPLKYVNNKWEPSQPDTTPGSDPNDAYQYDYWDHADYIINRCDELGMYAGVLPTWGDKVYRSTIFNTTNAYIYGWFLGDRYKAKKNIIWILGGDRAAMDGSTDYKGVWRAMAEGIADGVNGINSQNGSADYTTTFMTYHPSGWSSSSNWFHADAWLDCNMYQSGHNMYDNNYCWEQAKRDWDRTSPVKPVVDGEPAYEDHPVNWNPANGWFYDYDVRKDVYRSIFAGGLGITYGAHGIWQMYAPGRGAISSARTYWYDSLDFPGAFDMKHVKDLMLSRPFFVRVPDQTLMNTEGTGGDHAQATRASDGGYAMVYFPRETASITIYASRLSGAQINAWWYNPRDGKCYTQSGAQTTSPFETFNKADRTFDPPGSNSVLDWVLVLDDASRGYGAPGTQGQLPTPTPSMSPTPTMSPVPTPSPTPDTYIAAKKTLISLTMDGNLNESVWNLEKSASKTIIGTPNNTVTFGALWDANNLYV